MDDNQDTVHITNGNIPVFIIAVDCIIFFQAVFIVENTQCQFKADSVFLLVEFVFFFVSLKQ